MENATDVMEPPQAPESRPPKGWSYIPGLDGLRALAVCAVLAFHDGIGWFRGGLLGVDVFFVISGFLISSLLIGELNRSGSLNFAKFYERRARRLLPALIIMLLGIALYAVFLAPPSTRAGIRGDALSTMGYISNWHFILTDQNYFVKFAAPSPVLHTWSLAVEEQFYLVWPVLTWFIMRRWKARGVFITALGLALASAIEGYLLFRHGASSARLYYGTDLRVQEVMVGAALAAYWGGAQGSRSAITTLGRHGTFGRFVVLIWGFVGLGILGWAFHAVDGAGGFLYRGGFLLIAVAALGLIATVVELPRSPIALAFSLRPIRYVGRISYGLYLYHWPLFQALSGPRTGLHGPPLLILRLVVTFAISAASFHVIEEPIRRRQGIFQGHGAAWLSVAGVVVVASLVGATWSNGGTLPETAAAAEAAYGAVLATPPPPPATPLVRTMLVGDSMTLVLGTGLAVNSEAWGVSVTNRSWIGCDILPDSLVQFQGKPPEPRAHGCPDWRTKWPTYLEAIRPDVSVLGVGRWEVSDRLINGRWYSIADAALQNLIAQNLDDAITVLSSTGAQVALMTLPYIAQTTTAPDGSVWDINQPWRTDIFNRLIFEAASRHPGVATVIDLNKMLDPRGVYTDTLKGVAVRDSDREHPSVAGGMYLRPQILTEIHRLGTPHALAQG